MQAAHADVALAIAAKAKPEVRSRKREGLRSGNASSDRTAKVSCMAMNSSRGVAEELRVTALAFCRDSLKLT